MYIFASKVHLWNERKYQHCILCFRCQSVGNKAAGRRGKNSSESSQVMDSNTSPIWISTACLRLPILDSVITCRVSCNVKIFQD